MSAFLESWTGLYLLDPWMLLLIFLVPLCLKIRRWRGAPTVRFAPALLFRCTNRSGHDAAGAPAPTDEFTEPRPTWRIRLPSAPHPQFSRPARFGEALR